MYNKSKNGLLFAIFILIILLIVSILVLSVHNTRKNDIEEYKISLNNTIYDKDYSYIPLDNDAILKKEWDGNYYLYLNDNSTKYDLGTETVFYDKAKKQVSIYGTVYQVYSNSDVSKKEKKTSISNLDEFQFFKLNDRKYLVIGDSIVSDNFEANNYLIVSIDKGGNALLINNDVNIKTIHPLILTIGDIKFDIANEKLIVNDESIDLKKINGSTNEYTLENEDEETTDSNSDNNQNTNQENNNANNNTTNTQIYNDIVKQIINISGLLGGNNTVNNTNLYKNVSLRSVNPGASYIDVTYSVIDPEDRYVSVFIALKDEEENTSFYYLSKEASSYRISGLKPNKRYEVSINYITTSSSQSMVADSVIVLTSTDPTVLRINKINGNVITYNVKVYSEYEFNSADVGLTNCNGEVLNSEKLNIESALSQSGVSGELSLNSYKGQYVCLQLLNAIDVYGNDVTVNSYHKVKIN